MPVTEGRFPRRHRLRTRDFVAVLHEGKAIRGRGVAILLKGNLDAHPRLGMVVPKRIARRSVDRSRIKRVLREWFRRNRERLSGHDCVVRLSSPGQDEQSMLGELDRLLGRSRSLL